MPTLSDLTLNLKYTGRVPYYRIINNSFLVYQNPYNLFFSFYFIVVY